MKPDELADAYRQVVRPGSGLAGRLLPRRWVVERTLARITRHRRCARDYERLPAHHEAMVRWSMIRITSQRLTKYNTRPR